jgi:hypothetical protein
MFGTPKLDVYIHIPRNNNSHNNNHNHNKKVFHRSHIHTLFFFHSFFVCALRLSCLISFSSLPKIRSSKFNLDVLYYNNCYNTLFLSRNNIIHQSCRTFIVYTYHWIKSYRMSVCVCVCVRVTLCLSLQDNNNTTLMVLPSLFWLF